VVKLAKNDFVINLLECGEMDTQTYAFGATKGNNRIYFVQIANGKEAVGESKKH